MSGGEGQNTQMMYTFRALEAYDPAANRWPVLPSMPVSRHGLPGAMMVIQNHPAEEMLRRGKDHFDRLYEESAASCRVMAIAVQPYISGVPHRVRYLEGNYVFMMFLPTLRFLTRPLPPGALAARFFAAVMRPPLDFFAMSSLLFASPGNRAMTLIGYDDCALVRLLTHLGGEKRP